jgi:heme exporter protein C
MWGTYWVWDARLTSELILLFLYFGFMALNRAFSEQRTGDRASAILALVGLVNLPIIHYSVVWWNTLHQGPTVFVGTHSDISMRMLVPLLVMIAAFMLYFATFVMKRLQFEIIRRERSTAWIRELL